MWSLYPAPVRLILMNHDEQDVVVLTPLQQFFAEKGGYYKTPAGENTALLNVNAQVGSQAIQ
jgi:hypothetical protein